MQKLGAELDAENVSACLSQSTRNPNLPTVPTSVQNLEAELDAENASACLSHQRHAVSGRVKLLRNLSGVPLIPKGNRCGERGAYGRKSHL